MFQSFSLPALPAKMIPDKIAHVGLGRIFYGQMPCPLRVGVLRIDSYEHGNPGGIYGKKG